MTSCQKSETMHVAKFWLILFEVCLIRAHHLQLEDKDYFHLLGRVKHEEEDNRVEQERLKGSILVYGDKIQVGSKLKATDGQPGQIGLIDKI